MVFDLGFMNCCCFDVWLIVDAYFAVGLCGFWFFVVGFWCWVCALLVCCSRLVLFGCFVFGCYLWVVDCLVFVLGWLILAWIFVLRLWVYFVLILCCWFWGWWCRLMVCFITLRCFCGFACFVLLLLLTWTFIWILLELFLLLLDGLVLM